MIVPETRELILGSPVEAGVGRWVLAGTISGGRGLDPASPMRALESYALVAVRRGPVAYADAHGAAFDAATGDVLLIRPGVAHWYGTRRAGATWDELYVVFDGPLFDLCAAGGLFARTAPVARPEPSSLWPERLLRLLLDVARPAGPRLPAMVAFVGLLAELVPSADGPPPDRARPHTAADAVARARVLLASDLARPLGAPEVAAAVGMPYDSFRKAFREHSGTSPSRYRTQRRVAAARELIRYRPDMTNRELAELLGFSDEFHFSRRFTEHTGRTPRQFRADTRRP
ncbi:MAG TPA: AraC family transcriptional regulator [Solirubrobacteraceae bacterium]|nr:AraC family transcriptional regulator [Solirubrobacteraceae bacterium]